MKAVVTGPGLQDVSDDLDRDYVTFSEKQAQYSVLTVEMVKRITQSCAERIMNSNTLFFMDEEAKVQGNLKKKMVLGHVATQKGTCKSHDLHPRLSYWAPLVTLLEFPGHVGNGNPTLLYYPNLDVFF